VPGVIVHVHLDQHIAGEELPLGNALLAVLHFDDFLDRHQHLAELVLHRGAGNALDQGALHRFLETGIGVNDVPAFCHDFFQPRTRS
jgi:hypothetical protein